MSGIIDAVIALVDAGVLNQGQGNSLIAKLQASIQQLDRGNITAAINLLHAFINQVNSYIRREVLSREQGQPLIDAANEVILQITGGEPLSGGKTALRPKVFALYQNTPNPFTQQTTISYQLIAPSHTTLKIYDLSGRLVITLVDGEKDAGDYTINWNRKDDLGRVISNGVYFYRLTSDKFSQTRKLILMR